MSLGYTPGAVGLVIILSFAALAGLGIVAFVARLVLAAVGIRRSWTPLFLLATLIGGVLALSLALDTVGARVTAVVTSKRETVTITRSGGWNRTRQVAAHTTSGDPQQFLTLSPTEARYDALAEGDTIALRLLRAGPLSVVRDAQMTTWTWLPWTWIGVGLLGALVVVGAWKTARSLVVVVAVVAGVTWPLVSAWRDDRDANDLARMSVTATGVVGDVTRGTEWRLGSATSSSSRTFTTFDVRVPYDVVEVQVTPPGARSAVLAVDAVDVAADAPPTATRGATVTLRYAPGQPRDVRLDGHTRRWHWRDMAGVYAEDIGLILVFVAGALALSWAGTRLSTAFRAALRRR